MKIPTYLDADPLGLNGPPDPREDVKKGDRDEEPVPKCPKCDGKGRLYSAGYQPTCWMCEGSGEG